MDRINNNPYRILGVFSNATLKEITANKTKLARYASVGKSVSFDADMDGILPPPTRTSESVEKAFADLSLAQDKLKHALFWFVKDNAIDEMALGHLNIGNSDKAEELFEKRESWSSLHNSGVLALIKEDYGNAISCLSKVIHNSEYRIALVNAVCGDTYQIEESDLARIFVDSMKTIKPASELYNLFSANGYDASDADYLKGSIIEEPKEKLQSEISKASAEKEDGVAIYEAGVALQRNALPLLEQLEELLGKESMEYKLLVDKYAKALLQCCIDSFNTLQNKIEDGGAEQFKEYAPKVKNLLETIDTTKVSDVVKGRIETNMKTISEVVDDLDNYIQSNSNLCYYCGKEKADPSSQYMKTMYYVTGRYTSGNKRHVSYKSAQVGIERCKKCEKIHGKKNTVASVVFVLTILGSMLLIGFSNHSFWAGLLLGWMPGGLLILVLNPLLDGIFRLLFHTRMDERVRYHPYIKKMRKEGWQLNEPSA